MIQISTLRKRQRQNLLLAFLLSLAVVLGAYALLGFLPFGDGTLLTGDLNGLYVNYITDMWRRVAAGRLRVQFFQAGGRQHAGAVRLLHEQPVQPAVPAVPRAGHPPCGPADVRAAHSPDRRDGLFSIWGGILKAAPACCPG